MIRGLYAALATPLSRDYLVDYAKLVAHAGSVLAAGVDGVAIMATAGEGPSLSIAERVSAIDALAGAGITGERLVVATGAGNIEDSVTLSREALAAGAAAVLIVPPYYFKHVSHEGVFRFYAQLAERIADERLRVVVHHVPHLSGVAIDAASFERLRTAYPGTFAGVHDASGEWEQTEAWCLSARGREFAVTTNLETRAIEIAALGGAGCISGTLNVTAALARRVVDARLGDNALALQRRLAHECAVLREAGFVPAIKAFLAAAYDDPAWRTVMPPLAAFDDDASRRLAVALESQHVAGAVSQAGVPSMPRAEESTGSR